jgi:nitrate reductase beta subunit
MLYPYKEQHSKRQFAFVFNVNRCIGCQTCTMACKSTWTFSRGQEYMWWNNVESKPYGGYPHFWDQKLLAMLEGANPGGQSWDATRKDERSRYGVFEGKTIFEAISEEQNPEGETLQETSGRVLGYLPSDQDWDAPNINEDTARRPENLHRRWGGEGASLPAHQSWFFHLQRICNHCTYPGCLAACPRQAIYKRPEDGEIDVSGHHPNIGKVHRLLPPSGGQRFLHHARWGAHRDPLHGRLRGKDSDAGFCAAWPGWKLGGGSRKPALLHDQRRKDRSAANGYYIPPRWVPLPYLIQMFGPGAEHAVEAYVCPSRRMLGLLQLFRVAQKVMHRFKLVEGKKIGESEVTLPSGKKKTLEIFNDTVIGYDSKNREIIQLTVEEPVFERSKEHYNSI